MNDRAVSRDLVVRFFPKNRLIGTGIAAWINSGFRRAALEPLAGNPLAAVLGMSVLAVGLNLCSEADAFV